MNSLIYWWLLGLTNHRVVLCSADEHHWCNFLDWRLDYHCQLFGRQYFSEVT